LSFKKIIQRRFPESIYCTDPLISNWCSNWLRTSVHPHYTLNFTYSYSNYGIRNFPSHWEPLTVNLPSVYILRLWLQNDSYFVLKSNWSSSTTFFFKLKKFPNYRIVAVTIATICDSILWRLKTVTMRMVLESFKSLVLASSFWDVLWRPAFKFQKPSHCNGHKCNHLWRFCDSLKAVTMKTIKESFKSPSLSGFFVIICDFVFFTLH
jgi:hypothetical protein